MNGYQIFARTDKGPVREANEDHVLVGRIIKNSGVAALQLAQDDDFLQSSGLLCAVADGVGGAAGGATASKLALKVFDAQIYSFEKTAGDINAWADALRLAGERANRTVLDMAARRPELAGMGCTLTGVCLCAGGYLHFNAGDSRVYRYRNGFLKQLTQDDSIASLAAQAGLRAPESAEGSTAITNSIGAANFRLDVKQGPELRPGDFLIICSDGFYNSLSTDRIESLIKESSAETCADACMKAALAAPAQDNVSLIIIRCGS